MQFKETNNIMSNQQYEPLLPGPTAQSSNNQPESGEGNKPLKWILAAVGGLVMICLCISVIGAAAFFGFGNSLASRSSLAVAAPTVQVRSAATRAPSAESGKSATAVPSNRAKTTATPEASVDASLQQAYSLLNKGDGKGALAAANQAIAADPKSPAAYWVHGWINLRLEEKPELALKDFEKVIELEPDKGIGYSGRGQAYLAMNRHADAVKDLDSAIDKGANDEWSYTSRAEARLGGLAYAQSLSIDEAWLQIERDHKEDVSAALVDLDKALEKNGKFYFALNLRSFVHLNLRDYEKAVADADQMVTLQPKYFAAYNTRAWVYANWGKGEEAVKDCQKALDLVQSEDAAILDTCGLSYYAIGDFKQALDYYNRALAANSSQMDSVYRRAQAYQKLKDKPKAIADYRRYVKEGKSLLFLEECKKALKVLGAK